MGTVCKICATICRITQIISEKKSNQALSFDIHKGSIREVIVENIVLVILYRHPKYQVCWSTGRGKIPITFDSNKQTNKLNTY